ncbi:MAG: hypothetical protein ACR2PL_01040 [Dehalococcoidia bacterium]
MQTVRSPGAPLGYADITGVGVSWLFQRVDGVDFLMHDGGTFGQQSLIMFSPALQFGLVLLANASQALNLINGVSTWVLDHYLGLKDPPLQAVALSPDQLLAYEGRFAGFETPPAKALEFRANGNGLTLTGLDASGTPIGQASQLSLYADDHVFIPSGSSAGLRFDFVRDADGRIGWFRYLGRIVPRLA